MKNLSIKFLCLFCAVFSLSLVSFAQEVQPKSWKNLSETDKTEVKETQKSDPKSAEKADAVIERAVKRLGGEKYLQVKSQIGRGKFSLLQGGVNILYQSFTDIIVYPNMERTDFKAGGVKTVQTNFGDKGWIYDGNAQVIGEQNESQIDSFKRSMRTNLDNFLRGYWRGKADVSYIGKRPASLGKRNDVVKLTFEDGFEIEFEFAADDGLPMKSIYRKMNADNEEVTEEDRFAQFVDINGIKTPYIVDHFTNGKRASRVNYQSVEFNETIPDSIFQKPDNAKNLKDLKF